LVEAENHLKPMISRYQAEQERIRQEEEARIRRELAKQEEEARLQAAIEAEKAGHKAEAEEILSEPVPVSPVILPKTTPKVEGISSREVWKFRIVDATKIPREYMVPDEVGIGSVVRSTKGKVQIPGVEIYKESVVSAGRR
jgi:hypothetical protein